MPASDPPTPPAAPRTPLWQSIAATLGAEIAAGHYRPGDKLPTEAELSRRFGVNRHTVRRALADLADRGQVLPRRGAGVFVRHRPTEYPLGRRVRFHRAVEASGRLPGRRILRLQNRPATAEEARHLALPPDEPVLVCEGLSLVGAVPIAHFHSLFPATRLPGIGAALAEVASITEALRRAGVADYTRRQTRLSAEPADATLALHLGLREGDPVLKSEGLNCDPQGRPVEFGTTRFAGDRVAITVGSDPEDGNAGEDADHAMKNKEKRHADDTSPG
ncbi:GntR family transcriptional regulator [Defluviimonas sp. 20V17]|nr:GntR family transcriptional regulator [Defluviimonas sp. 20V17]